MFDSFDHIFTCMSRNILVLKSFTVVSHTVECYRLYVYNVEARMTAESLQPNCGRFTQWNFVLEMKNLSECPPTVKYWHGGLVKNFEMLKCVEI